MLKYIFSSTRGLLGASSAPAQVSSRYHNVPSLKATRRKEHPKESPVWKETLLANRTALVTNCNSQDGVGCHVALSLAAYGANVLVQGQQEPLLSELLARMPINHNQQQHAFLVAPMDDTSASTFSENVRQFTNSLEILVHNIDEDASRLEMNQIVNNSITKPYALFQSLLPLMESTSSPSVIFSSPQTSLEKPEDDDLQMVQFGHNASTMFTEMLAGSLAKRNVRVNAVDVNTDEVDNGPAFVWLARKDTQVTGSRLHAEDWARRDPTQFTKLY